MEKIANHCEVGHIKAYPESKFKPEDLLNTLAGLVKQGEAEGFTGMYITFHSFVDGAVDLVLMGDRLETDKEMAARLKVEKQQKLEEYQAFLERRDYYESEEGKKEIADLTE